ncbi:MAG: SDR family oxidoreductase [Candidatus Saccharicenans sp.]|jgi:NAD(P)-dependent dehydrogenase (short-subunit alcohol dehydrogenase family)|nr:SDR family oxidoreductase [Candidatus Saccharicenans sp.]MDH7575128.1 SDR family oxidoreductase [Candidatus Saccharicenans sp.]
MEFLSISEFEQKTAVVTGAAQGIGLVTAIGLLRNGARVMALDRDEEAISDALTDFLGEFSGRVEFLKCDLSDPSQIEESCLKILERANKIDVLVNNAGIGNWKKLEERTIAEWDEVINVNLRAPYLMVRYLLPGLPEGAAVVNIASTRALMSEADTEPYSASKGGLLALTHSLAVSLASRKIRVNAISPGWIEVLAYKKRRERKIPVLKETDHLQHPAGRVGKPEDVANAVLFLCSSLSGFITGTNLVVDGGMTVKMIYAE